MAEWLMWDTYAHLIKWMSALQEKTSAKLGFLRSIPDRVDTVF